MNKEFESFEDSVGISEDVKVSENSLRFQNVVRRFVPASRNALNAFFKRFAAAISWEQDEEELQGCNPPTIGDWIIDEEVTCENKNLLVDGDVRVNSGGSLNLISTTLTINSDSKGEHGLWVYGDYVSTNSDIQASNKNNYCVFEQSSTVNVAGGSFSGCGFHHSNIDQRGTIVKSYSAIFSGTEFNDNYYGLWIENTEEALITDCSFKENENAGMVLHYANNCVLEDLYFKNNYYGLNIAYSEYNEVNDLVIESEISTQDAHTGLIITASFHNVVDDVTVRGDHGWGLGFNQGGFNLVRGLIVEDWRHNAVNYNWNHAKKQSLQYSVLKRSFGSPDSYTISCTDQGSLEVVNVEYDSEFHDESCGFYDGGGTDKAVSAT
jgi:parallel beta-helix repeat protein